MAEKTVLLHGDETLAPNSPVQRGFLGRTLGHGLALDGARIIIPYMCLIHLHSAGLCRKGSNCKHFCKLLELPSCCPLGSGGAKPFGRLLRVLGACRSMLLKESNTLLSLDNCTQC